MKNYGSRCVARLQARRVNIRVDVRPKDRTLKMRLFERWLEDCSPSQRILDLGCGSGSLPAQLAGLHVPGVDIDVSAPAKNAGFPRACADSDQLPFASLSFDLVICHHSLEHVHDVPGTIREIRRVLRPTGRLFVTVPDGSSFSDRLYRFLLCGGGHLQRFTFQSIVGQIESGTGLHLAGWQELSSSFIFVDRRNFLPAPRGRLPGPLPRRMRWLGILPSWVLSGARIFLNLATRLMDRWFATRLSRYGWALGFTPVKQLPEQEIRRLNVCMFCGAGLDREPLERVAPSFYRCPHCSGVNCLFKGPAASGQFKQAGPAPGSICLNYVSKVHKSTLFLPVKPFIISHQHTARHVQNRRRMRTWFYLLAGVALLPFAGATTLLKMSMNDLILQSTSIVRARVTGSRTAAVGKDIFTYYQLQVSETLKKSAIPPVEFAVPGGVYGGLRQIGIGSPVFTEGQEYVLFLWTGRSGMTQVIGLSQGMFNLTTDSSGAIVLNRPAIADQMLDKSGKPVTDQAVTIKWSEFRDLIVKTLPKAAAK